MKRRRIPAVLVALLLLGACNNDDPSPGATADGGASSDGATSPDTVCRDACANVARCRAPERTDEAACTAQCAKELAGEGFLARDVAQIVFQSLSPSLDAACLPTSLDQGCVAKSVDEKCAVLSGPTAGWGFGVFPQLEDMPGGEIYSRLASKTKIVECAKKTGAFCGGDTEILDDPCLSRIYRYRPSTVALVEPCLARTYDGEPDKCVAFGKCLREANDIKGQPWLGPDLAE